MDFYTFMLAGMVSGLLAGLFGLGGGIVIVPALLFVFHQQQLFVENAMHIAVATSLMTIIVTGAMSSYTHWKQNNINWDVVKGLVPGLISGGLLGAYIATLFSTQQLELVFSIFLIIVAIKMWLPISQTTFGFLKNRLLQFPIANLVGMVSAMVGIGGGTITVPYLAHTGFSMHKAIGTSAFCGVPIALAAVISYLVFSPVTNSIDKAYMTGYIYWPAFFGVISSSIVFSFFGAKLAMKLPIAVLSKLFSLCLVTVACTLLAK